MKSQSSVDVKRIIREKLPNVDCVVEILFVVFRSPPQALNTFNSST